MAQHSEKSVKQKDIRTIDEALKVLDNMGQESTGEVRAIIARDYQHLKQTIAEIRPLLEDSLRAIGQVSKESFNNVKTGITNYSTHRAKAVDEAIRERPYFYIGSVALGASLIAYILGRRR